MDTTAAYEAFAVRYNKNHGKQIDNSKLHAGSPMYYYCNGCEVLVDVKSEGWFLSSPPKYCDDCQALVNNGILSAAKDFAKV